MSENFLEEPKTNEESFIAIAWMKYTLSALRLSSCLLYIDSTVSETFPHVPKTTVLIVKFHRIGSKLSTDNSHLFPQPTKLSVSSLFWAGENHTLAYTLEVVSEIGWSQTEASCYPNLIRDRIRSWQRRTRETLLYHAYYMYL